MENALDRDYSPALAAVLRATAEALAIQAETDALNIELFGSLGCDDDLFADVESPISLAA